MKTIANLQSQLGHIASFNSQIDARSTGIFALSTAILAVSAVNLKVSDFSNFWIFSSIVLLSVASIFTLLMIYLLSFPKLSSGGKNLAYFGDIANQPKADYLINLAASSNDAYADWIIEQVWVMSSIVARRFKYLRLATISLMFAALGFVAFLVFSSILHASLPVLKVG